MGDNLNELIRDYKNGDSAKFVLIVDMFKLLIRKYTRLLYKSEIEDTYSELVLALLEAIFKINYYDEEGQCVVYLSNALRNKFYELYRKSKKFSDNERSIEIEAIEDMPIKYNEYDNIIFVEDMNILISKSNGKTAEILHSILLNEDSDSILAGKFSVSRQYVNRVRRNIYALLKDKYYN